MNTKKLIDDFVLAHAKDIEMLTSSPELIHFLADYKKAIKFIVQISLVAEYAKNKEMEVLYEKLTLTMVEKHGDKVFTDLILEKL